MGHLNAYDCSVLLWIRRAVQYRMGTCIRYRTVLNFCTLLIETETAGLLCGACLTAGALDLDLDLYRTAYVPYCIPVATVRDIPMQYVYQYSGLDVRA